MPSRQRRVQQIKRAVAVGRYRVDPRRVAEAMLERDRRINGRSGQRSHRGNV